MLPKLARIHKNGTLVFIIATNSIGEFDLAIRRPGRFDRVVQIMPPTVPAKLSKKDWGPEKNGDVEAKFDSLKQKLDASIRRQLAELTFSEYEAFATELMKETSRKNALALLTETWKNCTLQSPVGKEAGKETWAARCRQEQKIYRL
jgi:hypothetical protein